MKKILIVDDNESLRESIKISLKKYQYDIDTACDGEAAMSMVINGEYDTIITDVYMPGTNGVEMAQKIYQNQPNIKFIIMTAHEFPVFSEPFEKIQKPFSSINLVNLIENDSLGGI